MSNVTNEDLLEAGKTTSQWLKLGKPERKLYLRDAQDGLCHFCKEELPDDPSLFDIARPDGHPYSKRDYRDRSICYAAHPVCPNILPPIGHQPTDHGNIPWFTGLAAVVQAREEIQRMRMRLNNRVLAGQREMDDPSLIPGNLAGLPEQVEIWEGKLTEDLETLMKDAQPIAIQAMAVPGVGPTTIARILAEIDIYLAEYPSSLHKFAGFAPGFDKMRKGELDEETGRRKRGNKRAYNARLKTACRVQADSLMKMGIGAIKKAAFPGLEADERKERWDALSPRQKHNLALKHGRDLYARDYLKRRVQTEDRGWTNDHIHSDALRIMIKLFLSHLWERWRMLEGLPTERPYIVNGSNGHNYIAPEERGWPELE